MKLPPRRTAKLPPDQDEIARAREYRALIKDLVHAAAELAFATVAQGIAEAKAAPPAPAQAEPKPAPKPATPKPVPPKTAKPEPAANPRRPALPSGGAKPGAIVAQLLRGIEALIKLDAELGDRIARAHKTAEMAGLNHPHRQTILDYLHEAVRDEKPWQFQRQSHNEIEIIVSEELGYAPDRNPGDLIAQICRQFRLPNKPADYPNGWRPIRDWPDD